MCYNRRKVITGLSYQLIQIAGTGFGCRNAIVYRGGMFDEQ